MKKILDWVFGSCFRTLGRFLAIFIVFALLLFVGSKLDIELPRWFALNVNAKTVENWTLGLDGLNEVYMYDCTSSNSCTNSLSVDSYSVYSVDRYYVQTTGTPPLVYTNGVLIQVSESKTYMPGYLYSVNMYVCTSSFATTPTRTLFSTTWADRTTGISTDVYNSVTNVYSMSNQPFANEELTFSSCHSVSSIFSPSKNTTSIIYRFKTPNQSQRIDFAIIGLKVENLGVYDKSLVNQIDEIIDNSGYATAESVEEVNQAVNQVKQEIEQTNDTITNDDTTGAQDSVGGFFDDFQSDDFGLSSIVTAPLRGINAMLNDTCIAPSATYKGQTFSLPCGSMLWSRPGGEDFKSFINIMYGGFLAYLVIRKFFLDVEDLKNPNSDKVEVDKL